MMCPKCNQRMTYDSAAALYRCRSCGHRIEKPYESLDEAASRMQAARPRPFVPITHRGQVELRARTLFELAHDSLHQGDQAEAARQFRKAIEMQRDFTDAHLWLAKIAATDAEKREHLSEVLAHDPGHGEAIRLMMTLNGQLQPAQVSSQDMLYPRTETRATDAPVDARTEVLTCSVCGGSLTTDPVTRKVVCRFCGNEEKLAPAAIPNERVENLTMALIQRRAQPVRWQIGSRMLKCRNCGAARTIPATRLSEACPFCASTHVIVQDALASITQPDALVPFAIGEDEARAAVHKRLQNVDQRIAGFFSENRVISQNFEGVYLPFWMFDVLMEVRITITEKQDKWSDRRSYRSLRPAYQSFVTQDGETGLAVPGFTTPEPALALELGDFDYEPMRAYEPKLLARHAAELYDVDFEKASLEARSMCSRRARARAVREYRQNDNEVSASALPLQMTFTLVLLPVWVVTLIERDGDVRPVLVHGQTARVALGKARPAVW
jgi:DNA-directed RNA polymerase subunit M/transcription elongation factor TFIIS